MENISGSQTSASALSNSALRGTLPLFGETQANSPSLSSSICERLVWHFCPREGCETLNLHLNSHLIFLRVRSNVEILNKDDNSICQLSGRPSVELTTTSTLIITSAPRTIPVVTAPARTISREYFIIISLTNVL